MSLTLPQRILVAPSGFKGSLSASEVARCIADGIHRVAPSLSVSTVPVPDGGEGTAELLTEATGGRLEHRTVTGPVGEPVESHFALLGGEQEGVAVVEMAAAAGLSLVPRDMRNPGATTTYGVGELIAAALDIPEVHTVLIGCGDSGTSDGGAGALAGLGAKIVDAAGEQIAWGGAALGQATAIDLSNLHPRAREVRMVLALNQHNVLTGPQGVARVFGPQKGATAEQVEELDAALTHWAHLLQETRLELEPADTTDFLTGAGTGASGGLGAGLALLGAELTPRFEALIDSGLAGLELERELAVADCVITAEGAIDFQTVKGKVPAEIARRAQAQGIPVLALAGSIGERAEQVHEAGIDAFASIIPLPMDLEDAMEQGAELLTDSAERCFRLLMMGAEMGGALVQQDSALYSTAA